MRRLAVLFVLAFLGGCATKFMPADYAGPDAGKVVVGIGAATGTNYSSYSLFFRKKGDTSTTERSGTPGLLIFVPPNMVSRQKPDYSSAGEAGVVLVHSLPAGDYELFNLGAFYNTGVVQRTFSAKAPFSIPFTVSPGKVTYLGNHQANGITGGNILGSLPGGVIFAVSDRMTADLAIARSKDATLPSEALNATPSPKALGLPFFVEPRQP